MAASIVVTVDSLEKTYGDLRAVQSISFEVSEGEIFGMVGPNGAGKTTTIECIEGLRNPTSGSIKLLGMDPQTGGSALRQRIGIQLQETVLQDRIKVWEVMDLYASFYPKSTEWNDLLQQLGLGDHRNQHFSKLSGGQKQRLFVALALIHDPEVIFLDELTTGLDPHARRAIWDLIFSVRDRGKTIFLTTHFMDEAERLCDRVAILDQGKIVAIDTPDNLIDQLEEGNRVLFTALNPVDENKLQSSTHVTRVETTGDRVIVHGKSDQMIADVVNYLTSNQIRFRNLRTEQPNLEDVFLTLTGRSIPN